MEILTLLFSERGVRREPTLLPKDYTGGSKDSGSIGFWFTSTIYMYLQNIVWNIAAESDVTP